MSRPGCQLTLLIQFAVQIMGCILLDVVSGCLCLGSRFRRDFMLSKVGSLSWGLDRHEASLMRLLKGGKSAFMHALQCWLVSGGWHGTIRMLRWPLKSYF